MSRSGDGLIRFLRELIQTCEDAREMYQQMNLPQITESIINECLDDIPVEVDRDFIRDFILNGQSVIREIIDTGEGMCEDEDNSMGMML